MASERARHRLHNSLKGAIGEENAGNLMEMLPPFSWHDIARRSDIDSLREMIDIKIDAVETRLEGKIDSVEARLEGKIDAMFARVVLANLGLVLAVCGLLLAAIKLGL